MRSFVVNVSILSDLLKESGFSRHFVRHRFSRSITRAIDRQAKHIPLWYTVRGHLQGALREGPTLVGLVQISVVLYSPIVWPQVYREWAITNA